MNVVIAGGSGFLGQALTEALLARGDEVMWITRDPNRVSVHEGLSMATWDNLPEQADVVINLAGAGIADEPWTAKRKQQLIDSRLEPTQALVEWMHAMPQPPRLFMSGSAIGWYGPTGEAVTDETSGFNPDFGHELCAAWEHAALPAIEADIPTVFLRTGVVLEPSGGMLKNTLPAFRMGMGGRYGSGEQWLSWISREDWARAVLFLLDHPKSQGIYNLTAPNPVRNREFTKELGRVLRRPTWLPLPVWLLRRLFGEMSALLLDSQRVVPNRLHHEGFVFLNSHIDHTLERLLRPTSVAVV